MIMLVLPDPAPDDDLLKRARRGDKTAIASIYEQYADSIYQYCRLRLSDPQSAEDVTSTVFTRMIRQLAKGKGPRKHLRGWLFQVARNAIIDRYGEVRPLGLDAVDQWYSSDSSEPEVFVTERLNAEQVRACIAQLSSDQQDVLFLRFGQALSLQETADVLGKNVNTVKTLQFRAISRLRDILQREGTVNS